MRVYIQQQDSDWITPNCYIAAYWFRERGYEVVPFTWDDLKEQRLDLSADTPLVGGVGAVKEALRQIGAPQPPNINIPASIKKWADRNVWCSTLGEFRLLVQQEPEKLPLHIKPQDRHKVFNGMVVRRFRDLIPSAHVPPETTIVVQEVVTFVSEWRVFVLNGKILNVSNYRGDPITFPAPTTITLAVAEFTDAPVAYGIDFGVTDKQKTLLVEVNDAFSLGSYGLVGPQYIEMIEARWQEMVNHS